MKVRKNPREAILKFIEKAADFFKEWMNSAQHYTTDQCNNPVAFRLIL